MKLISRPLLTLLLIPTLLVSPLPAQSPAPLPAIDGPRPSLDLQLRVADSDGVEAKTNSSSARGLTIEVTTASGAAVPETAVALRLPDNGPTGSFPDGAHSAVVYTDTMGRAQFAAVHWGATPGSVAMRITATKGSSHAALLLDQKLTSQTATVMDVPAPSAPAAVPATAPVVIQQPVAQVSSPVSTHAPISAPASPTSSPSPSVMVRQVNRQPGQTRSAQSTAPSLAASEASKSTSSIATAPPDPHVSVSGAGQERRSGKTKWIILAAVAAAAGAGVALAGHGGSSPAAVPVNSLVIGTPSVSIGHP